MGRSSRGRAPQWFPAASTAAPATGALFVSMTRTITSRPGFRTMPGRCLALRIGRVEAIREEPDPITTGRTGEQRPAVDSLSLGSESRMTRPGQSHRQPRDQ